MKHKTKQEHIRDLTNTENQILRYINRCTKEAHIPIWLLRNWGSEIMNVRRYLQRTIKRKKRRI